MTSLFGDDLYNPGKVETFAEEFGVPASSPQAVGAGQTGKTITVEATSIEAYRGLDLPAREQAVLIGLRRYAIVHGHAPTSYELFKEMHSDGCAFDVNAVRPRLTHLFQTGCVTRKSKRVCRITGKNAYTWAITKEQP